MCNTSNTFFKLHDKSFFIFRNSYMELNMSKNQAITTKCSLFYLLYIFISCTNQESRSPLRFVMRSRHDSPNCCWTFSSVIVLQEKKNFQIFIPVITRLRQMSLVNRKCLVHTTSMKVSHANSLTLWEISIILEIKIKEKQNFKMGA